MTEEMARHPYARAQRDVRNVCHCGLGASHRVHFVRSCEFSRHAAVFGEPGLCQECNQPLERGRAPWARYCRRRDCVAKRAREFTAQTARRRAEGRATARI